MHVRLPTQVIVNLFLVGEVRMILVGGPVRVVECKLFTSRLIIIYDVGLWVRVQDAGFLSFHANYGRTS